MVSPQIQVLHPHYAQEIVFFHWGTHTFPPKLILIMCTYIYIDIYIYTYIIWDRPAGYIRNISSKKLEVWLKFG